MRRRGLALTLAVAALLLLGQPASAAVPVDRPTDAQWAQTLAAAGHWVDLQTALEVMFAESGGNPTALNSSGAEGAWQFMPNTLADHNCRIDPVCSTAAAFRVSSGGSNWSKWEAYTSGAYTRQAARAAAAIQAAGQAPSAPLPSLPSVPSVPQATSLPPASAGMGIDGLVQPPPIQHGNQPLLYERYPAGDYTPLHQDAVSLAKSTLAALLGFDNPAGLALNVSLNDAASLCMDLVLLIGVATTRLLAWSLKVDLLASADGPLNAVVGGFAQGLYQPLVPLLLMLVCGWLIWTWLLRRRTMRGFVGIGWVFLAMTLSAIYFANPAGVLDQASGFTSAISGTVLGAVGGADAQVARHGDPTIAQGSAEDAELRLFSDRFWTTFVYQPWTDAQFGHFDPKGASGKPLGIELLEARASGDSSAFDQDMSQQPKEVQNWYQGSAGGARLVVALATLLVAASTGVVFMAAAVARLAAMVVFLAALMSLPLVLLLALHPTVGRKLLLRWVELAVGALWRQVIYSLFIAVMVVMVGVASAAAAAGGWGLVAFCQVAGMAGVLIFRKPLLALFGQFGGRHAKVQHVGSSKATQTVHQRLGTARQGVPIPAFARRQAAASATPTQAPRAGKTASTSTAATAGTSQAAASGAKVAAAGNWYTLVGAAAIKGGQLALRHTETAKRQLQGSVGPLLLDKASSPPPRRMPEKPLGVDHGAVRTHAWNKALRRTAPAPAAAGPAAPSPRALPEPKQPHSPKSPPRPKWVREPGGAHVLQHKP